MLPSALSADDLHFGIVGEVYQLRDKRAMEMNYTDQSSKFQAEIVKRSRVGRRNLLGPNRSNNVMIVRPMCNYEQIK